MKIQNLKVNFAHYVIALCVVACIGDRPVFAQTPKVRTANKQVSADYKIRFSGQPHTGVEYDSNTERGWMMVPHGGSNQCDAQWIGTSGPNPADLKWVFDEKKISFQIAKSEEFASIANISVSGKEKGYAAVVANGISQSGIKKVGKLDISILAPKSYSVNLIFLRDGASPTPHKTSRSLSSAQSHINQLNTVFGKQANIKFVLKEAFEAEVRSDMGGPTTYPFPLEINSANFSNITDVVHKEPDRIYEPADLNVFFVWKALVDPNDDKHDSVGMANCPGTKCLVADNAQSSALPHEIGHNLGLLHEESSFSNLMHPKSINSELIKAQILQINAP